MRELTGHLMQPDPQADGYCTCGLPASNRRHHQVPTLDQRTEPYISGGLWPEPQPATPAERDQIDTAIRLAATRYVTFSANEVRKLLTGTPSNNKLVGARYAALIRRREIRPTGGTVRSDDPATHGHKIALYTKGPNLQRIQEVN